MNFFATETEPALLHPHEDPEVIRLQTALDNARRTSESARAVWNTYCATHPDEVGVPFRRDKQRFYEAVTDTAEAVQDAEAAYTHALEEATQRATAAWDDLIRQQFADDQSTIAAFVAVLERHEATVIEAQAAGVAHVLHVPSVFLTAAEVRARLAYAQQQLGIE